MNIKQIVRKSVSGEVVEQIKEQIISGSWQPGARIPGEIELTQTLGVSRISIREAIQRLVGMGILTVRRGEGTFVTEMLPGEYFNALLPMLMLEDASLMDILEFRSILEIQSAGLAAARATAEDIKRLEEIYRHMVDTQHDMERFAIEDLNFHTAMALATGNQVIIKVNSIIHDMLRAAMQEIVETFGSEGGLHYHHRLLEAIANRDEQAAACYMKEHLDDTLKKLQQMKKQP